tara:strand:+ start:2495 stop:3391 length:897 start_codon:yes stop_codon:yes gene_type:complete
MEPSNIITELSDVEKQWWDETIKQFRSEFIREPKHYSDTTLRQKGVTLEQLQENTDQMIEELREETWQLYLLDEAVFHQEVLAYLVRERDLPKNILNAIIDEKVLTEDYKDIGKEEFTLRIAGVIGEYTGKVMPYIYALSLSTTQSRRSRSGQTFEAIVESFMDVFGYSYDNQSSVGTDSFSESGLGKKVDLIVPGMEEYSRNRSKSAVVTVKTTLRERWQEVAEELQRTNVPHIYLLTADTGVSVPTIDTMSRYNITLVVYSTEKEGKFANKENVMDFQTFYNQEMPHIISYWNSRR